MLSMCRLIFVSVKVVVLGSGFFVAKGITYLKDKGVYGGAMINKWRCWPKGGPGVLIDTHFEYEEFGDVRIIESRNQYNRSFRIFCMKDTDHVMNILVSWITLDDSEGAKTGRYFIDISGTNETKQFTYRHPFGISFR